MSLSATLFGRDSLIFKATNIMGLGIPGWLDKQFGAGEQPGQALGELSQQTAKEGETRPIIWGRVRPIGGNLMHCQAPVKRWVKQKTEGGKGGGGGKKEQKVEHVYRTYAIGVCEGPITAFARIWRNNKLVYDGRGTAWGAKNNGVFLKSFRLYLGGWNQMPSPDLEAIWGAGNVPAYRGTAYIVSVNEDLTELGGSVPQFLFEVERAEGVYLTSRPYRVESIEQLGVGPALDDVVQKDIIINRDSSPDYLSVTPSILSVLLSDVSPKPVEYLSFEPSIEQIRLSEPAFTTDHLTLEPNVINIKYSINVDSFEFHGLAVSPSILEVVLT